MEVGTNNIYEYFNGNCHYIIPIYQRNYSWERKQCLRLWNDIVNIHKSEKKEHFIGSIVRVIDNSTQVNLNIMSIIDGQQRLTTVTLLLVALRDYVKETKDPDVNHEEITNTLLVNQFKHDNFKYKLLLKQPDREILINLIKGKVQFADESKSNILENYNFFLDQIKNSVKDNTTEDKNSLSTSKLYDAIEKLQVVGISLNLKDGDKPQAIFESLNSTGADLQESDLIRNFLLMDLGSDDQKTIYEDFWQPTEKFFNYNNTILNGFLRYYLIMKLGELLNVNEAYMKFRNYTETKAISARDLCEDIHRFAKYYSNMLFINNKSNEADNIELNSLYQDIITIRMEVAYPFLLQVHDDYYHKKLITIKELQEILRLCISYVLRRAVCDMPPNALNKIFAKMIQKINPDDYLNSIKASFYNLDSSQSFPNDEQFHDAFITKNIYKMSRADTSLKKLRIGTINQLLKLISCPLNTFFHRIQIFPQNGDLLLVQTGKRFKISLYTQLVI